VEGVQAGIFPAGPAEANGSMECLKTLNMGFPCGTCRSDGPVESLKIEAVAILSKMFVS